MYPQKKKKTFDFLLMLALLCFSSLRITMPLAVNRTREDDGDCGRKPHPSFLLSRWLLPMKLPYWQE